MNVKIAIIDFISLCIIVISSVIFAVVPVMYCKSFISLPSERIVRTERYRVPLYGVENLPTFAYGADICHHFMVLHDSNGSIYRISKIYKSMLRRSFIFCEKCENVVDALYRGLAEARLAANLGLVRTVGVHNNVNVAVEDIALFFQKEVVRPYMLFRDNCQHFCSRFERLATKIDA